MSNAKFQHLTQGQRARIRHELAKVRGGDYFKRARQLARYYGVRLGTIELVDANRRDKCRQTPDCHQYDPSPIIAGAR
uniref:Helix-turn-helix DNA binding domain protein n=1 Tax=Mycobacterium phage Wildflower TaxID=3141619 RepID=A0AB38ZP50_9VIRU